VINFSWTVVSISAKCRSLSGGKLKSVITDPEYLTSFQSFIEEKYDCKRHSWDRILLHVPDDEYSALTLFSEKIVLFERSMWSDVKTHPEKGPSRPDLNPQQPTVAAQRRQSARCLHFGVAQCGQAIIFRVNSLFPCNGLRGSCAVAGHGTAIFCRRAAHYQRRRPLPIRLSGG
jgi:hypothetical protein